MSLPNPIARGRVAAVLAVIILLGAANPDQVASTPYPPISAMVDAVKADRLQKDVEQLVAFGTRNDFSETTSTSTHGVFAARDWIAHQFEGIAATAGGRMSVSLDTYLQAKTPKTPRPVTESSVIATLRGEEPGRIYVMSSHFDDCDGHCTDGAGVAPGADDNGSSVAAVIEAARVMAGTHFRGTIVFACFDGEELGLWGSNHYAQELAAAHAPVAAVLNNDIIGNSVGGDGVSEPNVVRVFSEGLPAGTKISAVNFVGSENDSPSRELSRFVAEVVPVYVPEFTVRQIYRADRFLRGGDQESFQSAGLLGGDSLRRVARELHPPASRRARAGRRAIRRFAAIHRRAVPAPRDSGQRCGARDAGARACIAKRAFNSSSAISGTTLPCDGKRRPTQRRTKSFGGRPIHRNGRRVATSATSRRRPFRSRRTTTSSGCAA